MIKILVVNGWTKDGDNQHEKANCILQKNLFKDLIKDTLPNSNVDLCDTYEEGPSINLNSYDAFMWTGGGGNIYENNNHNNFQLDLCKKILERKKPIWGSCWGMQVIVTALGGKVIKSEKPEFGYSKNIEIINPVLNKSIYKNKLKIFDAPAHHFDIVESIPIDFEIISKNDFCIQSIYSRSNNIFCTQYHSELPYDYISNLMIFWRQQYQQFFSNLEFNNLIETLNNKENKDFGQRLIEINNWLKLLS